METISKILDEFPEVVVLSDEVYDFLCFDERKHIPFATVGNNWDRTVSMYSGGKLFNATGWKVGWTIAPEPLIHLGGVIANTTFYCFNVPGQEAMSGALDFINKPYLDTGKSYTHAIRDIFIGNREQVLKECRERDMPWEPLPCEGGYFVMTDISKCKDLIPEKYLSSHDYEASPENPVTKYELNMPDGRVPLDLAFCRWMGCEKGVTMMPNSFFYHRDSPTICDNYVRMAICKNPDATAKALERLRNIKI